MLGNFSSKCFLNFQGTEVVVYKIVVILVVVVVVVVNKLVMSFRSRSDVSLQASKVWCFSQMAFFFFCVELVPRSRLSVCFGNGDVAFISSLRRRLASFVGVTAHLRDTFSPSAL